MRKTNKDGVVLIMVMSFLTVLMFIAGTVMFVLNVNVKQAGYGSTAAGAFQAADAGADYVQSRLRAEEISNVVTLRPANVRVNYAAPAGYSFDTVTNLTRLPSGRAYSYRVTGHKGTANATVEVIVGRSQWSMYGIFSDEPISIKPGGTIQSYDSSQTTNPTASTHDASVASNEGVGGGSTAIDGSIYLGENAIGIPATYAYEFSTPASVVRTSRIDKDPLGAASGILSNLFRYVAVSNNNGAATGATVSGTKIRILNDVTLTAGNYYVLDIDLGNNKKLNINAAAGPVRLFLTGNAYTSPNADIVVTPPRPENLQIFSQTPATMLFQPHSSFVGFIYAPFASLDIKPNGNFYGALWGDSVSIWPGGSIYVDTDFVATFDGGEPLTRLGWKQILE